MILDIFFILKSLQVIQNFNYNLVIADFEVNFFRGDTRRDDFKNEY